MPRGRGGKSLGLVYQALMGGGYQGGRGANSPRSLQYIADAHKLNPDQQRAFGASLLASWAPNKAPIGTPQIEAGLHAAMGISTPAQRSLGAGLGARTGGARAPEVSSGRPTRGVMALRDDEAMVPMPRGSMDIAPRGRGDIVPRGSGDIVPHVTKVEAQLVRSPRSNKTAQTQEQFGTAMTPMGNMGMLGAAGVGGLIGGTTSYATGGEFGQGFAVGAVGGFAGRGLKQAAMANMAGGGKGGLTFTKKFAGSSWATPRGTDSSALAVAGSALNRGAQSVQTMSSRAAFMGGAGLAGVMFGGDRTSHRRGFNQSRGSRF